MAGIFGCLALSLALAVFMITQEKKKAPLGVYLSKTMASVSFVTAGFLAFPLSAGSLQTRLLILGGLCLGMLGDIFLCRKQIARVEFWPQLMIAGGGFFLFGHLSYFAAFCLMLRRNYPWTFLAVPALGLLVLILLNQKSWNLPRKQWPGYIAYALASGLLLAGGAEVLIRGENGVAGMILFIAGVLFVFSDLALGTYNFSKLHSLWMRYICILSYYSAQALFVLGLWMM